VEPGLKDVVYVWERIAYWMYIEKMYIIGDQNWEWRISNIMMFLKYKLFNFYMKVKKSFLIFIKRKIMTAQLGGSNKKIHGKSCCLYYRHVNNCETLPYILIY